MRLPRLRLTVGWVMALAPFLICACFAFAILVLSGFVTLLHVVHLDGLILPVYCVGMLAAVPLGFLSAVRIGRLLLDEGVGKDDR